VDEDGKCLFFQNWGAMIWMPLKFVLGSPKRTGEQDFGMFIGANLVVWAVGP